MSLQSIQGQERALDEIVKRLDEDRFIGSFLFAGPEGVGKRSTAIALTAAIFCEASCQGERASDSLRASEPGGAGEKLAERFPRYDACSNCPSCYQVAQESHPDLLILEPEEDKAIKIESVRNMLHTLSLRPMQAERKVVVINRAETLTVGAANALLKSLEEPGEHNTFVLISSAPGRLLPTIISRCQRINFVPLRKEFDELSETIGCDFPTLFHKFALSSYIDLGPLIEKLPVSAHDMSILLEGLRAVCRDLLILKTLGPQGTDLLIFSQSIPTLQEWGLALQPNQIYSIINEISAAEEGISYNVTPQLLWETVALSIQKAAARENIYA